MFQLCLDCSDAWGGENKAVDPRLRIKAFESADGTDAALPARADGALFAFLRGELPLALKYAQTANVEARHDAETENRARERARESVETIRWFRGRISDPVVHLELQEGAARVEKLLSGP
jgi:hypothetical protein